MPDPLRRHRSYRFVGEAFVGEAFEGVAFVGEAFNGAVAAGIRLTDAGRSPQATASSRKANNTAINVTRFIKSKLLRFK